MEHAIPATEARKNFAEILDEAMIKPVFINRRKNDYMTLSTNQLSELLPVTPELDGEPEDYSLYIKEIPQIVGFGSTIDETLEDLNYALSDYASIYLSDLDKYYQTSNTKPHLLYVVLFADLDLEKFKEKINAKLERS